MRLQKFLSRAEVASRRRAEEMIRDGRVRVNGQIVTEMGVQVDPATDRVEVDGSAVRIAAGVWIALHKPAGYLSTRDDPRGRPTVYDLLPSDLQGLFHVGRLDWASEGLLLLTNQGDVAHRLLHPRYEIQRVYDVVVEGEIGSTEIQRLLEGVRLEDGVARAERVKLLAPTRAGRARLRLALREGRYREVRRMFDALGRPVRRLVRRHYGPIALGRLPRGAWRRLTEGEVERLERAAAEAGARSGRGRAHE